MGKEFSAESVCTCEKKKEVLYRDKCPLYNSYYSEHAIWILVVVDQYRKLTTHRFRELYHENERA